MTKILRLVVVLAVSVAALLGLTRQRRPCTQAHAQAGAGAVHRQEVGRATEGNRQADLEGPQGKGGGSQGGTGSGEGGVPARGDDDAAADGAPSDSACDLGACPGSAERSDQFERVGHGCCEQPDQQQRRPLW